MARRRRSITQLILLLLSLVGVGISIYLTTVHYENAPLICSSQGIVDCARVLASSYSVVPGTTLPITIPGMGWSLVSAVFAGIGIYLAMAPRWLRLAQFALALLGMIAVLYLVYVEIVRLHTICAWCTGMHAVILLIFLVTLVQLQQTQPDQDLSLEEEFPVPSTRTRK